MKILVCNAGSTSLKFKLYDMPACKVLAQCKIERVGSVDDAIFQYVNRVTGQQIDKENQNIPDYRSGIKRFLDCLISSSEGVIPAIEEIQRVGYKATLSKNHFGVHELTDEVVRGMRQWLPLARLHNTAYIETIRTMREALPDALFLGAFETGFHREIPLERKLYGVPYLIRRFPTKQLFLVSMSVFTIGLLLAAVADTFALLMIGRVLQAAGKGVVMSLTQVVILTIFPIERRGTVMGIYGLAIGAAPVIAPTLAGIVIDSLGWHFIFWVCAALAVLDILIAVKVLDNILETVKQQFDSLSMLLCAIGFSGLFIGMGNLGIHQFLSLFVGGPMAIGLVALAVFVQRQFHLKEPFLELRTFKNREFRLGVIMNMLMFAILMGGGTLIPIYIQTLRGYSATISGIIAMPGALAMAVVSPFAGKIYDKVGIGKLSIVGSGALLIGSIGISFLSDSTSMIYIAATFVLRLLAVGLVLMPAVTWSLSTMGAENAVHGTALLSSLRTITGAISCAVFTSIMTVAASGFQRLNLADADIQGINAAFMGISVIALIQFLLSVFLIKRRDGLDVKREIIQHHN
ncbi:MAG: DHA2 family efflux MFS transporter permease subunit [Christensenellales bacterium]|jgi:EmrB/QacA subfamily drug resistance transporter